MVSVKPEENNPKETGLCMTSLVAQYFPCVTAADRCISEFLVHVFLSRLFQVGSGGDCETGSFSGRGKPKQKRRKLTSGFLGKFILRQALSVFMNSLHNPANFSTSAECLKQENLNFSVPCIVHDCPLISRLVYIECGARGKQRLLWRAY